MFLLFIKFKFLRKNGVSEKIDAHLLQHPPPLQQLFSPPLPSEKEVRDYAFYMRDYKGETPLSPFSMTKFLFTELYSHNI